MKIGGKLGRLNDAGPGSRSRAGEGAAVEEAAAAPAEPTAWDLHPTPHGPLHATLRRFDPGHHHGRTPVRDALEVRAEIVARLALDVGLEGVDPRRMLLLDTETTGLAGGAGTLPFLVGLAWFEQGALRVEQLFVPRPGQEPPLLHRLAERLEAASCIVSYNGKSFDWPLVRNRYVLNRVPMPDPPPHLDLLHCARRVYKRRFERMKLTDLEAELLGMHREGDVPGWEIPSIYQQWLRGGDASQLEPVFEHNVHDLVALAALLGRVACRFESIEASDDPRDHLSYAEVAMRAGDPERAWAFARAAAERRGDPEHTARAWMLLARLARRQGALDTEIGALEAAVEAADSELTRAEAHLMAAKLHEHRTRDLARALVHAERTTPYEDEPACAHRLARLRRKRERAERG